MIAHRYQESEEILITKYKDCMSILRLEKCEVLTITGSNKNLLPILHTWNGKFGGVQPANLNLFPNILYMRVQPGPEERIAHYEKINNSFQDTIAPIRSQAGVAAAKIILKLVEISTH